MHNPLLVVAIAAYVTVVHLGMLIASLLLPELAPCNAPSNYKDVKARRGVAAGVAYASAAVTAIVFGVMRRAKAKTHITYWATLLILIFGLSFAIYTAFPKVDVDDAPPSYLQTREQWNKAASIVNIVALVVAVGSWVGANHLLKPIDG